jgi:hypothetical protein
MGKRQSGGGKGGQNRKKVETSAATDISTQKQISQI